MLNRRRVPSLAAVAVSLVALVLAGCSANTSNSVDAKDATVAVSQTASGTPAPNPTVTIPFFITGANFDVNKDVRIRIYEGTDTKGKVDFDTKVKASSTGAFSYQFKGKLDDGQYTVSAESGGEKPEFQFIVGAVKKGVTKVSWSGPAGMLSPTLANGNLYVAQSGNGGSIFQFAQSSLPSTFQSEAVTVKPGSSWQPQMPANVKMEQIAFDNDGKQLLMGKKSMNINTAGGNSVWAYPYGDAGSGQLLAGVTSTKGNGYYAWGPGAGPDTQPHNTAEGAFKYTSKAYPTKSPTDAIIGDGAGVAQAANGWYYYSSLQSGCVYKMSPDKSWADYVYCIPSWGANNQNQSVYSLAEDAAGNVYAVYQGATNNNTVILKITPSGGEADDQVQAIQVSGWARSVGLAVSSDGSTIFTNGTSMAQYNEFNTNSILTIQQPKWGAVDAPTATTPTDVLTISGTPWLNGMAYDQAKNIVYVADNTGGFWMNYR